MTQTTKHEPQKDFYGTINHAAISRAKRDMTSFCELLNSTISDLKQRFLLYGDVDEELLHDFVCYRTDAAEERLKAQAIEEANKLQPYQRNNILNSVDALADEIRAAINALASDVERNRLKKGLYLSPFERSQFITAKNGLAHFDEKRIEDAYTIAVDTDEAAAYINEAKALFEQICAFDRKTRLYSGNRLRGVCENNTYKSGVIECYNGIIELDLSVLAQIDFDTDPAVLESSANPGRYKITTQS